MVERCDMSATDLPVSQKKHCLKRKTSNAYVMSHDNYLYSRQQHCIRMAITTHEETRGFGSVEAGEFSRCPWPMSHQRIMKPAILAAGWKIHGSFANNK
jgi:hypothetical protein